MHKIPQVRVDGRARRRICPRAGERARRARDDAWPRAGDDARRRASRTKHSSSCPASTSRPMARMRRSCCSLTTTWPRSTQILGGQIYLAGAPRRGRFLVGGVGAGVDGMRAFVAHVKRRARRGAGRRAHQPDHDAGARCGADRGDRRAAACRARARNRPLVTSRSASSAARASSSSRPTRRPSRSQRARSG